MSRKVIIEHNGKTYTGEIATVKRTFLGFEDHGVFTADLQFEWQNAGISIGGYSLDTPHNDESGKFIDRIGSAYGLDYIMRVVETFGVSSWEAIEGQVAIVLYEGMHSAGTWGLRAAGFAHIEDPNKVFIVKDHLEDWKREHGV